MSGHPYIAVLDLETTGFNPAEHAPCEIGHADVLATAFDLLGEPTEWGRVTAPISVLLHPGRSIPPETSAIHHLVDEDVAGATPWREAFAAMKHGHALLRGIAAHTAKFERQWLTPEFTGDVPWICTWKCALRAWPDAPGHSNQILRYWLKPEGLIRSIADRAHRAGPDAYVTAFTLRELLRVHPLATLIRWTEEPAVLVRVPFGKYTRGELWTEVDDGFLHWVIERDFAEEVLYTARREILRRRLNDYYAPPEIETWLASEQPLLGGRLPLDCPLHDVLAVINQLDSGVHP